MKTSRHRIIVRTVSLSVVALFALGTGLASAQTGPDQPPSSTEPAAMKMKKMMGAQGGMMADRQQLLAEMKALDQKLDDLVARMNAAEGNDKLDAVAAVVRELVAQRAMLHDRMIGMQDGMMERMKSMMMGAEQANPPPDPAAPHQH